MKNTTTNNLNIIFFIALTFCSIAIEISSLKLQKFQKSLTEKTNTSEKTSNPTCPANSKILGFKGFGFKGQCFSGKDIQNKLMNSLEPLGNKLLGDVWSDYIAPVMSKVPLLKLRGSGCVGDFSTDKLKTLQGAKMAKCSNFPLPAGDKMSAISLTIKKFKCPQNEDIEMCAVFDGCGTFGWSMNAGLGSCITSKIPGVGALLAPALKSTKFAQFGYSPNRMWVNSMELLDSNFSKKMVEMKANVYMGVNFGMPQVGIKIGKQDISKYFSSTINGKAFIDFGAKNDFTPTNLEKLLNDKNKSVTDKTLQLLSTAREYSVQCKGTLKILLSKITDGFIPDLAIMSDMDYNLLINLGKGPDGDRGSSGMPAGIHYFFSPPAGNIFAGFVKQITKGVFMMFRIANLPVPKIPNLRGVTMGMSIGQKVGFKINVANFSFQCQVQFSPKFAISCKTKLGFLSIFKEQFKWIGTQGKKVFEAGQKVFASFAATGAGHFVGDMGAGAVEYFKNLVDIGKKAVEAAKKALHAAKEKTKKARKAIGNAGKKAVQLINNAGNAAKNAANAIGNTFNKGIKSIGKLFKRKACFGNRRCKRRRRNKENEKKRKEQEERNKRDRELAAAKKKEADEIAKINSDKAREEAQEKQDLANAESEENAAEQKKNKDEADLNNSLTRQKDMESAE